MTDEPVQHVAEVPEVAAAAEVDEIVAAASAALGRPLAEPVALPGGDWSVVLRCQDRAADSTVIVKSYPRAEGAADSFASEAAGLALAAGTGLAPELLAADTGRLLVVMSDLGAGASLADLLLGDVAGDVSSAVLSWARTCGELSAATSGRREQLAGLRSRYARGAEDRLPGAELQDNIDAVPARSAALGVAAPAGLAADLADVGAAVQPDRFGVFSPGDLCPDNNLVTAEGVRLLDFEAAGIHSVFLDAAYIRMPFSTCWCVFRLPAGLSDAAEACYRQLVCGIWPDLADDQVWQSGVRRGIAAWTMNSMGWLLRRSMQQDRPLDDGRTSPRTRQLMRHRWQVLLAELDASGDLPALAALTRALLAATAGWQAPVLPLYPAFRSR